jgi:hypothetical protein
LRDFFLVAVSSVVRQVALADPRISVPVILEPRNFSDVNERRAIRADLARRRDADPFALMGRAVNSNLRRLEVWASACQGSAQVVGKDARTFAKAAYLGAGDLADDANGRIDEIDLVLTSPPYANAQRYTRSLRLELFVLGFTASSTEECALDSSHIGTERIPKREFEQYFTPSTSQAADLVIQSVRKDDPYRAAIVGKYVQDMERVLSNCYNALKPGRHAVLVTGNNTVRGRTVDNAAILTELAMSTGFERIVHIRNRIPSRGLLTKRHHTAGVITHEHVLVLKKPPQSLRV